MKKEMGKEEVWKTNIRKKKEL